MKKLINSFLILLTATFTIKILNFLRELELSYFYGTNEIVNDYLMMSIIPNIILNSLAPAVGIYLLTIIVQSNSHIINMDKKRFLNIIIILLLFSVGNFLLLKESNIHLIINSTFIIYLYFIQVLLVYYHQAHSNFTTGAVTSNVQAIIIILLIYVSYQLNVPNLIFYSITIALIIQILALSISVYKNSYIIRVNDSRDSDFYKNILSIFLSIGIVEILISLAKIFISFQSGDGNLATFNYAFKLANLPNSIVIFSLVSVLFPKLAKISEDTLLLNLNKHLTNLILCVFSIISVLVIYFSEQLVFIVYGRGQFTASDSQIVSAELSLLIIFMIFISVITIQYRVIYLNNKFWSIIKNSILQICILIVFLLINFIFIDNTYLILLALLISTFTGMIFNFIILKHNATTLIIICMILITTVLVSQNIFIGLLVIIILFSLSYVYFKKLLKESRG